MAIHHELFSLRHWDHAHPSDRVRELQNELGVCTTAARMSELKAAINVLSSVESANDSRRVLGLIRTDFEAMEQAVRNHVQKCVEVTKEMRETALSCERVFFAANGLQHDQTEVSRRYDKLISELNHLTINAHTLHWFGVEDITVVNTSENGSTH